MNVLLALLGVPTPVWIVILVAVGILLAWKFVKFAVKVALLAALLLAAFLAARALGWV